MEVKAKEPSFGSHRKVAPLILACVRSARQIKSLDFSRYALSSCVAAAMLAACGGSQSPIGAPGAMQHGTAMTTPAASDGSWMLPEAKNENLLYVGSYVTDDVYVYSYPKGKLVGTLTGITDPQSLCSDLKGNIWISSDVNGSSGVGEILEYPHGGKTAITTLRDPQTPAACAVDPATGNLAVANSDGNGPYYGELAIYGDGQGQPTLYSVYPPSGDLYGTTYDNNGDVFVIGLKDSWHDKSGVFWLRKGASTVKNFPLHPHVAPRGVQWDGQALAVVNSPSIYRFKIGRRSGKAVGPRIETSAAFDQFWIQGSTAIGTAESYGTISFWKYPSGGTPTKTITGVDHPYGVTVSLAPK